jgi:hypothetical protein
VLVPQTHAQAIELEKQNNNTDWQEAAAIKMRQRLEYKTFVDKGIGGNVPSGYKRINCHMIYDSKHDGSHKVRLVSGGLVGSKYGKCIFQCCIAARYLVKFILSC